MKRKCLTSLLLCSILICWLVGCGQVQENDLTVDYGEYTFADVIWIREENGDIERLCFLSDGGYRYSCACGNPIDSADVVESYTYDATSQIFTLNYLEEHDGMISQIKLINCDGDMLELDFGGEIRSFVREDAKLQGNIQKFNVDLRKMNLIIEELADPAGVQAARNVVDF